MALSAEERTLIYRAVRRDREAFAELYVQYYNAVLRRVTSIVHQRDEAEDIAGETFLRAWNAVTRFEDRDVSILAWLCKIAERRAYEHIRKRRPSVDLEEVSLEADNGEGPEEVAERKAEAVAVRQALIKLPNLQREVLSQRFLNQSSYDDVAQALGKPVGTVRVIQHRALAALKGILKEDSVVQDGSTRPTGVLK